MKRGIRRILVIIDTDAGAASEVADILTSGAAAEGCSIEEIKIKEDSLGADYACAIVKS